MRDVDFRFLPLGKLEDIRAFDVIRAKDQEQGHAGYRRIGDHYLGRHLGVHRQGYPKHGIYLPDARTDSCNNARGSFEKNTFAGT